MLQKFRINITLRLIGLVALIFVLIYCLLETEFYITMGILILSIGLSLWSLLNYVDRSNRDVASFLEGLKFGDYTATYQGGNKGASFEKLYDTFQKVNKKFQEIETAKEINHLYLQTIVESVNVGLLCLGENGEILLLNKAMKELLQKPFLHNVEALQKSHPEFYKVVDNMRSGEKELVKLSIKNQLLQLSVQVTEFRLQDQYYKLISLQNIQREMEEQELQAWQKLIRILTHEIMNSVAPIVSLTSSMGDLFQAERNELSKIELQDIRQAIGAIQNRSAGLLKFTETYRNLTRIPVPEFKEVDIQALLKNIATLFREELDRKGINFILDLPPQQLTVQADAELMERALINFLKNAIDAVADQPEAQITMRASKNSDGQIDLQISDNGIGIEEEQLDQIFVPFFTTKESGTGIGLSLSRQIIRQHHGNIKLQSKVGEGTIFTLTF